MRNRKGSTPQKGRLDEEPKRPLPSRKEDSWSNEQDFDLTMMLALSAFRMFSGFFGVINDCDEVYNYWEPLHLFLYGEGFQTWEYSPIYAIRSYFYIGLHYIPAWFVSFRPKVEVFIFIRCILSLLCACGEYYAYRAICRNINARTGRFFYFFSVFSPGVFLASATFLPSSFCMSLSYYIIASFVSRRWTLGIFCVAFSALVGWPFSAVIGLPFVVHMLFVEDLKSEFVLASLGSGLGIGVVQFLTDTHYFGKPVVASLNIVLYNVLSGPGPSLYGEEPITFYIKNLFLNWNIAVFIILLGCPLTLWRFWASRRAGGLGAFYRRNSSVVLFAITAALWMLIFGSQAHKEERFLFPIYPFIALLAAVVYNCFFETIIGQLAVNQRTIITVMILSCFALLSTSRAFSVHRNYAAQSEIYEVLEKELGSGVEYNVNFRFGMEENGVNKDERINPGSNDVQICVGKEWHRFPSSFFVPNYDRNGRKVRMQFVKSEFTGLLPKPFKATMNLIDSTRHEPSDMNNMNKEETSRYVSLDSCDYFVDLDMPATELEPNLGEKPTEWKPIITRPFIDLSKPTKYFGLLRAFYVPHFSDKANSMTTYTVYKKISE